MSSDAPKADFAQRPPRGEEPMYELIELFFFAYRDFVADADRLLEAYGFGRAHHRALYFVTRRPGLTIAELLEILRITNKVSTGCCENSSTRILLRSEPGLWIAGAGSFMRPSTASVWH